MLLLDTSMPTMDGIEALPAILALCPDTTVVMFSGFEGTGLATRARELGAVDFIEKSLPLEELPQRLLQSLDKAAAGPAVAHRPEPEPGLVEHPSETGLDIAGVEQAIISEHLEQFRALFDRAAIGMATLTVNGTIVRANAALAALMSCEPYDLVGVDYGRLTGGRGEDLDRHLEALRSPAQELATFEHHLPVPAGEPAVQIARVTLAPIRDSTGQVLYVFAQVQDISAQRAAQDKLRRSEENFRLLVTAVGDYAIFMLDTEGHVISWNSGAQRIKGYAASDILGRHFRVFYPSAEQEDGHPERNLAAALRGGSFTEEGWRLRSDGSRFWASVVISPVHDDRGRHIGFAKVTRDQTEQREYEEDRRTAIAQQTHLLAVTAHELRNPTAVIDGSVGALQTSWAQMSLNEREEYLDGIRSSADRLRRLAADLAAASRLQGDGLRFRVEDVPLPALLRGAAARREAATPEARIAIVATDDAVVRADGGRLAQAVDNLLDNAVRHGTPPFVLSGAVDAGQVQIRVTDAGPGVPEELTSRLFERFTTGGAGGGTGLGLYLVREIARGHGGDAVYRPPGPGQPTTFEIRLPAGSAGVSARR
jgi:PAS domain S-box-containing protein